MSKISEYVTLGTMYRDAHNYKNCDMVSYSNAFNVTDEEILKRIQPFIDDAIDFVPDYYNIPSISPVSNEFMGEPESPDHPFQTITDITFHENDYDHRLVIHEDINELLNRIDNPEIIEKAQAEAKRYAKDYFQKVLLDLEDDTKIIVTVEGGTVTAVGSNKSSIKVIVLDYDKNADEPIIISEQLEPDYQFIDGEAWKNWDSENISPEDLQVKRHLKKIKF